MAEGHTRKIRRGAVSLLARGRRRRAMLHIPLAKSHARRLYAICLSPLEFGFLANHHDSTEIPHHSPLE
jgi:hypothetical protein